ncbi:PseG/SpsG family protein [Halobellus captivus]|uniref:PseG/SpsG family protein n=1 Tax=Halobellus captivus TaxID=2592614 RepID=UPI0011A504B8|nr:hypothetical protein [Halobellus captivus]
MRVAIRADGNTKMGYGHLFRSNTVARALHESGFSVSYLTETPEPASSVCIDQAEIIEMDGRDELLSTVRELSPDAIFLDLPDAPVKLQRTLREEALLAVFLGSARNTLACDILVNGHFFAKDEEYKWVDEEPIWCLGPDYLPLRQPFPSLASRSKKCPQELERGIILMGGSDPHNLTPAAMNAFEGLGVKVTVVVGPGNENIKAINHTRDTLGGSYDIQRNPDDLPIQMFNADVAISGFGTTAYELIATKTPFVGVTRNNLERETADKISKHVGVPYLNRSDSCTRLRINLQALVSDHGTRVSLRDRFAELVDGKGSKRIAREIKARLDL